MSIKGAVVGMLLAIAGIAILRRISPDTAVNLLGVNPPKPS